MTDMTRGELARRSGVSAAAIRFYEENGILPPPRRSPSGYRLYSEDYLVKIKFIQDTKQLGYSLKEISEVLKLLGNDMEPDTLRELVRGKIAELDSRIDHLRLVQTVLGRLLETPEDSIYNYLDSFRDHGAQKNE